MYVHLTVGRAHIPQPDFVVLLSDIFKSIFKTILLAVFLYPLQVQAVRPNAKVRTSASRTALQKLVWYDLSIERKSKVVWMANHFIYDPDYVVNT